MSNILTFKKMVMIPPAIIGQYLIVCGDPENGFWYMGPFRTSERARQHGKAHMREENTWWVAEMLTPDKREGRI